MTLQEFETDLKQLLAQKEQLVANANAVAGIIQYVEQKIAVLKSAAEAVVEKVADAV